MEGLTTAMTTAFTSVVGDVTTAMTSIAPIALPLVGIGLVVSIGLKFFKKTASKAA